MKRSRRVLVAAHCLLNVNSKVKGLATYEGVHPSLFPLMAAGVGIVQLPCPELTYLGLRRWGMTKEQYDCPGYRRYCRSIAISTADQLAEYGREGYELVGLVGVDGSPSCGVTLTCSGYCGGEVAATLSDGLPEVTEERGRGIMIEELLLELSARGMELRLEAVSESAFGEPIPLFEAGDEPS